MMQTNNQRPVFGYYNATAEDYLRDPRFEGLTPSPSCVYLSSPTMHGEEQHWVDEAIKTNWVSTIGANINEIEKLTAAKIGRKHAVALSTGTAALHLSVRLAGERLYGPKPANVGTLTGRKVFCSDCTFDATANPIAYEGGEAIFIDTDLATWNMSPEALEKAFALYPDVRLIMLAHLYGTPAKCDEIRRIADAHNALIIEDAAESFGSTYHGIQTGMFGDYSIISFNGNKIVTGSAGGMFVTDSKEDANKVRKWSTQSRENASWYQHEELGYNYRMSNIVAGVIRGQLPYLEVHIAQKKAIYDAYENGFKDLPVKMNPTPENTEPNHWLSCLTINEEALCKTVRGEREALYYSTPGTSCPTEILGALSAFNFQGRPIWKPMHMQPIYRNHPFITTEGVARGRSNAYIHEGAAVDNGKWLFKHGLCLPSDNKMTAEQIASVIEIVKRCFG